MNVRARSRLPSSAAGACTLAGWMKGLSLLETSARETPSNNKMQRTKPGLDGASPLILVLSGPPKDRRPPQ